MDSQSQFTQGGRVTRSQSKPAKPPKLRNSRNTTKPPPRYAESSSSPQNSGEGISTSDAEFVETTNSPPYLLPERLFAPNLYPDKPRLNIYSKANVIGSIVKSLARTPKLQCLLESQFSPLFHLPVARCLNSAKLCDPFVPQKARTGPLPLAASEDEGGVGRMWRKLFEIEDLDVPFATGSDCSCGWTYCLWPQTSAFNGVICRNGRPQSTECGPSRPRRGVGKEPELSESGGISEEVKSWFRRELSAQLGVLREEIYGWTHPNEKISNNDSSREVAQPDNAYNLPNIAEGGSTPPPDELVLSKDPTAFESQSAVPTTSDAQEVRRKNDRCTDIEPLHCRCIEVYDRRTATECRMVTTVFLMCQERHKFPDVEEVPTAGLNLFETMGGYFVEEIEEVEETVEGGVVKEAEEVGQSENDSMAMVLYGKPTAYVLPSEVCHKSHNVGNPTPHPPIPEKKEASPTNSEDYKTPTRA
ncbi:hypothetical protein Bca4012_083458 [Brassica carinata]|uniref:Uncharacterized protein n=1 Tax=Brassica carinata TaxID=52824 RepID=A0A8X7SJK1_BRACI|nr:hypothetical protein Bca52824_027270 [Brassica carinata]